MKFDTTKELERLASILETKANTSRAKAAEYAKCGETSWAKRETARAENATHFVEVCIEASTKLKARAKRAGFTPPAISEIIEYCRTELPTWPSTDILKWFDHFQSVGWKIGSGKQMVDWKSAARNGFRNWQQKNPNAKASAETKEPHGWQAFLLTQPIGFRGTEYRHAPGFIKEEFRKTL